MKQPHGVPRPTGGTEQAEGQRTGRGQVVVGWPRWALCLAVKGEDSADAEKT